MAMYHRGIKERNGKSWLCTRRYKATDNGTPHSFMISAFVNILHEMIFRFAPNTLI